MRPLPANLQILSTADGSPTLAFRRDDGYVEKMHHSGGAVSESHFIYRHALDLASEFGEPIRLLSFGLGLGYNELISLAWAKRKHLTSLKIWSFEAVDFLREEFEAWIFGQSRSELGAVTEQVARAVACDQAMDPNELRSWARKALETGALELRRSFPEDSAGCDSINIVYYDAYSKKMNPTLWTEDYIAGTLGPLLNPHCVLATYAATGTLNRALKQLGFCLLPRPGFLGKRESTLAIRHGL